MQTLLRLLIVAVLLWAPAMSIQADDRIEPVDIIIALDKSLSMEEEIGAIKEYVSSRIVDQTLQEGDRFIVVSFYGQNEVSLSTLIENTTERDSIKNVIGTLAADGQFTDIGFALDRLRDEVVGHTEPGRKKTLLLITDGIDEPPPGSKYATPGGWRSHEYMRVTSETQREGWKIIVLGVGTESAAEIAKDLSAQYVEVQSEDQGKPTAQEIAVAVPDLTGTMVVKDLTMTPVNRRGRFKVNMTVVTETYSQEPELAIKNVSFRGTGDSGPAQLSDLLAEAFSTKLPKDGETEISLSLRAETPPAPGTYAGSLGFVFAGKEQFDGQIPASLRVNSFLRNYPWLIPAALAALAAIVILLAMAVAARSRLRLKLIVEEKPLPKGKDEFVVRKGRDAYLKETRDRFDIGETKTPKSIAKLTYTEKGLSLERIKEDRFPEIKHDEEDVLGGRYLVRSEGGADFHLRFESAS